MTSTSTAVTLGIVGAFCALTSCATPAYPLGSPRDRWTVEQEEVVEAIDAYVAAWNRFDADALASLCREDCDRIDARGNVYRDREAIREHYTRAFASPPPDGTVRKLTYEILSVRIVAPGVAVVDARYEVQSPPPLPDATVRGMNTVVLVRTDGRWLRVAHRQRLPFEMPRGTAPREIGSAPPGG